MGWLTPRMASDAIKPFAAGPRGDPHRLCRRSIRTGAAVPAARMPNGGLAVLAQWSALAARAEAGAQPDESPDSHRGTIGAGCRSTFTLGDLHTMLPNESYASPTGKFAFRVVAWEARMSHWIESFTLVDAATGTIVWRMDDPNWSLDEAKWISDSVVEISIRKYPGDHSPPSFEVTIDCEARTAAVMGGPSMPLSRAEPCLEQLYSRGRNV